MPPKRSVRSSSRRNTPVSPPKGASEQESPRRARRSTRSASRDLESQVQQRREGADQGLETVAEGNETNTESPRYATPDEQIVPQDSPGDDDKPNDLFLDHSTEGSYSLTELQSLDRQGIIDNLEELYNDARGLLSSIPLEDPKLLVQFQSTARQPGSLGFQRLERSRRRFEISREAYGSRLYINTKTILRKLARKEESSETLEQPHRLESILQLANLASFIATIFGGTKDQIEDSLQFMFHDFPRSFLPTLSTAERSLAPAETRDLIAVTLELQTQLLIKASQHQISDPSYDPDRVLQDLFWDDGDNDDSDEVLLRGLNFGGQESRAKFEELAERRIEEIRKFFTQDPKNPIRLDELEEHFSWSQFLLLLADWSRRRKRELMAEINGYSGVESIVKDLQESKLGPLIESYIPPKGTQSIGKPTTNQSGTASGQVRLGADTVPSQDGSKVASTSKPAQGSQLYREIARFKEIQAGRSSRGSAAVQPLVALTQPVDRPETPPASAEGQGAVIADSGVLGGFDDEEIPILSPQPTQSQVAPTQQTAIVMETLARHRTQRDKENAGVPRAKKAFIERQDDAERIQFSDNDDGNSGRAKQKRRRAEPFDMSDTEDEVEQPGRGNDSNRDEDDEDDEAFENDRRSPKRSRIEKAKPKPPSAQLRDDPESMFFPADDNDSHPSSSSRQLPPKSSNGPRETSSSHPEPRRPLELLAPVISQSVAMSQTDRVNAMAKRATRLVKEYRGESTVQQRKPYSAEEVDRLLELIELHGTKWSHMLEEDQKHLDGPRLQGRSQVQLKDKARNIKRDYIKACQTLPPGFTNVALGEKMIRELKAMGFSVDGEAPVRPGVV